MTMPASYPADPRRPHEVVLGFDHAALTAGKGSRFFKVPTGKTFRVDRVDYYNEVGLVEDATNYFGVTLRRTGTPGALVFADATFTTTHGTETVNLVAHGLLTGDGPLRMTNSGGALPAGYAAATDYYVIRTGDDALQLAASRALAYAGTAVAISGDGTGTHTLSDTADTIRPVTVASGVDTNSALAGTNTLAPDTTVAMTLSATDTNNVLSAGDELIFVAAEGGSTTLPAGRMTVHGRYV